MGLKVEKPDVNASRYEYYGRGDTVHIGFMQIKNLSSGLAKAIAPEREKNGPYRGVADFMERTGAGLSDTALLIRAECFRNAANGAVGEATDAAVGAGDDLVPASPVAGGANPRGEGSPATAPLTQPQLLYVAHAFDRRRERGSARTGVARAAGGPRSNPAGRPRTPPRASSPAPLFTALSATFFTPASATDRDFAPPPMRDVSPLQRIRNELELYGFPVSIHPMEHWRKKVRDGRVILGKDVGKHVGETIRVAGILITAKTVLTKRNDLMQFISFEDETAIFETVFFPKTYSRFSRRLANQRPYILTGRVDSEFGVVTLNVREVEALGEEPETRASSNAPVAACFSSEVRPAAAAHFSAGDRTAADSSGRVSRGMNGKMNDERWKI
jgi:error-prone DNA polymerase